MKKWRREAHGFCSFDDGGAGRRYGVAVAARDKVRTCGTSTMRTSDDVLWREGDASRSRDADNSLQRRRNDADVRVKGILSVSAFSLFFVHTNLWSHFCQL
ncbi:unnamed protein product [Cuscuta europaea]|uniref:Uncharacterized protein n=1 Tax=Cuscuta europaea TaxID=41803 RepID=A0A9P0YH31_CUSEU|nr:unnamed protein product [Cuscuta europaea]